MTISRRCQGENTLTCFYLIEKRHPATVHDLLYPGGMTAAPANIRLRPLIGIAVTSIAFITGICQAETSASPGVASNHGLIPAQFSMGRPPGPAPGARTTQTPPAKPHAGLTPEEQKGFAEAMKHLTPKERRRLTKAIKRFTPEESRQFIEGVKRQLAAKGTASRAIKPLR
jgi:hypothetical protein